VFQYYRPLKVIICLASILLVRKLVKGQTLIVNELFEKLKRMQVKEDVPFSIFPPHWQAHRGSYPSEVKLNFHGAKEFALIREMFKVPDVNMFAPAWVTECLIEAFAYGNAPKASSEQVELALDAINMFTNMNEAGATSEKTFWPQMLNASTKTYESTPVNLFEVLGFPDYLPNEAIEKFLELIGLKGLEEVYERLLKEKYGLFFST